MMRDKKKYQFVLSYSMKTNMIKSDAAYNQYNANADLLDDGDKYSQAPKLQIDSDSLQLLDVIQKQSKGDWIVWSSTAEDFTLVVRYEDL